MDDPSQNFPNKANGLLCSKILLQSVAFSREYIRLSVNKQFQRSTVQCGILNLLPFISQLENVSSECQEPRTQ